MAQGHIHKLSDKGFGFIRPTDGQKDLFFHARQVIDASFDELHEGDSVNFTRADDPQGRGPIATEVERITRAVPVSGAATPDRWHTLADVPTGDYEMDDTPAEEWGQAS